MNFSKLAFLLTLVLSLGIFQSLDAQEDQPSAESFYGFWEVQEPAGDTCVIIIKRGGRISCFWAGTSTTQIQKGKWSLEKGELVISWETGYLEVLRKLGENAIERASYDQGANLNTQPILVTRGVRVDKRLAGSLTVDRDKSDENVSNEIIDPQSAAAIPMRNAYTGYWKVSQPTGLFGLGNNDDSFFLNLQRNGDVLVALRNWKEKEDIVGKWTIEGDMVLVTWPSGRKDVLKPSGENSYLFNEFGDKKTIADKPNASRKAEKITALEGDRFFKAGGFSTLTVADIRGTWIPQQLGTQRESIEIEGWGNAYRMPSKIGQGSDPGKWRLLNDRVVITWVDGSKDVIRLEVDKFIQESYAPGEPVTGTPFVVKEVIKSDQ